MLLASLILMSSGAGCRPSPTEHEAVAAVRTLPWETVARGTLTLPNHATSVKFAVIGDSGRGSRAQREVAAQMARYRERFPFEFVLMLGDNIYEGPATADDYRTQVRRAVSGAARRGRQVLRRARQPR